MGCNCGGRATRRTVTVYRLVLPGGATRDYRTRQEADAANRRHGGRGKVIAVNR